jgi:hypothetical protein
VPLRRNVSMSAEDALNISGAGIMKCPTRHFVSKPQPARIESIQVTGQHLMLAIHLL